LPIAGWCFISPPPFSATPIKKSRLEQTANKQILAIFGLLFLMALACTIGYIIWVFFPQVVSLSTFSDGSLSVRRMGNQPEPGRGIWTGLPCNTQAWPVSRSSLSLSCSTTPWFLLGFLHLHLIARLLFLNLLFSPR